MIFSSNKKNSLITHLGLVYNKKDLAAEVVFKRFNGTVESIIKKS